MRALLAQRARAVRRQDRTAFEATMQGAPRGFVLERLQWFDRLAGIPLGSYRLVLDEDGHADLSPALKTQPDADEVRVVAVTERLALAGIDERPSADTLYLTVVRRGRRWAVIDDAGVSDLGMYSARSPWDFASIRVDATDEVLVLFHDDADTAARLRRETAAARARVRAKWPLAWDESVVLILPRSSSDLARMFQTTIDLSPFVAFASASADRTGGGYRLTASRVFVQPDTFFRHSSSFQASTLGHELLHVATRGIAGAFTPSWLAEGTAQVYGEPAPPESGTLGARVAAGSDRGRLPAGHEFFLGSRDDIRESYQASGDFVVYLRARFGSDAPARFYRALGARSPVSFGTGRYHLDRASRAVFKVPFPAVERAWLARLAARFG